MSRSNGPSLVVKSPRRTFRGPTSVANDVFATVPQQFTEFQAQAERFIDAAEGRLVVTGTFRGRSKDGETLDTPFAHVWQMHNGKATSFEQYVAAEPWTWAGEASDARRCRRRSSPGMASCRGDTAVRPTSPPTNPEFHRPRMMSVNAIAQGRYDGTPGRRTPSTAEVHEGTDTERRARRRGAAHRGGYRASRSVPLRHFGLRPPPRTDRRFSVAVPSDGRQPFVRDRLNASAPVVLSTCLARVRAFSAIRPDAQSALLRSIELLDDGRRSHSVESSFRSRICAPPVRLTGSMRLPLHG